MICRVLLLLVSLAAGFGQPISEAIRIEGHVAVPMRDGVKLYADVYRPRRDGRFPTLITRTPYGVQRDGMHEAVIRFAQHGYAVVVQDTRGRYESEGAWDPFRNEANDGFDTVEWAAGQGWSNGKVGMHGGSYLGHVQWQAATMAPPHLTTIFPVLASTSIYHNTFFHGGAFKLALAFGWGAVRMPNRIMNPQYWHSEGYAPQELKYDQIVWTLPLTELDLASSGQRVGFFRDWLKHQSYDSYWKAISDEERLGKVRVPTYSLGGWFDLLVGGTINGFKGVRANGATAAAREGAKLIIGPWGHGPTRKYGDIDFGPTAMRDLFDLELRWNDRHLKGMQNGIDREAPVELFVMGVNKWAHFADWPVPGTRFTPLYLTSGGQANSSRGDGRLEFAVPAAGKDGYEYDPRNPVPSVGGNDCCGAPFPAGPRDQRPVEARQDVLVYSTGILKEAVTIAGPVEMRLFAATDGRDTDFVAKLVDVFPDGSAINLAEGILRARFHKGLDRMELLEPGKMYEFVIDMRGTANVFQPGHRIRVDVTSSNFPQYDRNPNTGEDLGVSARVRTAKQTVFHGGAGRSHIVLPVVTLP
jgi:putative CocE/NonD family hydrolase